MPTGVTGHRSISSGMAWFREARCNSSRVIGPVVGVVGAVAGALDSGAAAAVPTAAWRVLTLILQVWASGSVVSPAGSLVITPIPRRPDHGAPAPTAHLRR